MNDMDEMLQHIIFLIYDIMPDLEELQGGYSDVGETDKDIACENAIDCLLSATTYLEDALNLLDD